MLIILLMTYLSGLDIFYITSNQFIYLTYHLLVNLVAARNAMALRLSKSVTFPSKDSLSGVSLTVFLTLLG